MKKAFLFEETLETVWGVRFGGDRIGYVVSTQIGLEEQSWDNILVLAEKHGLTNISSQPIRQLLNRLSELETPKNPTKKAWINECINTAKAAFAKAGQVEDSTKWLEAWFGKNVPFFTRILAKEGEYSKYVVEHQEWVNRYLAELAQKTDQELGDLVLNWSRRADQFESKDELIEFIAEHNIGKLMEKIAWVQVHVWEEEQEDNRSKKKQRQPKEKVEKVT